MVWPHRYKGLFFGIDVTKFYFSYTYDITHTLQHNMTCRWYGLLYTLPGAL
jgi:hypothetical protein